MNWRDWLWTSNRNIMSPTGTDLEALIVLAVAEGEPVNSGYAAVAKYPSI
jgi:hypothetical protein